MKFENTEVWGFEHSLRGMRNPMNSWVKSDSDYYEAGIDDNFEHGIMWTPYHIGENDMKLAQNLIKAGNEHRKFLRQILVSVDITAPLYWWKEFDTYKVGTTANSTSTMHKLATTPITEDCFEMDDYEEYCDFHTDFLGEDGLSADDCESMIFCQWLPLLEGLRQKYLETKDKRYWKELIRWLPESWLQSRTITMNYENIHNMYFQRRNHKLTEWSKSFVEWVESLPYAAELIMYEPIK